MPYRCTNQIQNDRKQVLIYGSKMNRAQWKKLLFVATNPDLQSILLFTSDDDIAFDNIDSIHSHPPFSISGRLVAFLYKRFLYFREDTSKGVTIIDSRLTVEEVRQLICVVLEFAHLNNVDPAFMDWFEACVNFSIPSI